LGYGIISLVTESVVRMIGMGSGSQGFSSIDILSFSNPSITIVGLCSSSLGHWPLQMAALTNRKIQCSFEVVGLYQVIEGF